MIRTAETLKVINDTKTDCRLDGGGVRSATRLTTVGDRQQSSACLRKSNPWRIDGIDDQQLFFFLIDFFLLINQSFIKPDDDSSKVPKISNKK